MPVLDQACFLGLSQDERREQLYLALGGSEGGCFLGLMVVDQYREMLELIGSTACIFDDDQFFKEWLLFLDPEACTGLTLYDTQAAVYALLYAEAGDPTLPPPGCFLGLGPDGMFQALLEAVDQDEPTGTLVRLSTGLILNEPFNNINAWTNEGGWSFLASKGLFGFGSLPNYLVTPGTMDPDGIREMVVYQQAESAWWAVSDGGNGVDGWRQFLRFSDDRGLTWSEQGQFAGGIGTHAATATGWFESRGALFVDQVVTAETTFGAPNIGLPNAPYGFEIRSSSSIVGGFSIVGTVLPQAGTWTDIAVLPGSQVFSGGLYYHFAQGQVGSTFNTGILTGPSPVGPFTQLSNDPIADISTVGLFGRSCENPKVFYHPGLEKFVCLLNLIAPAPSLFTDRNAQLLSSSVSDWSSMDVHTHQFVAPCWGENTVGVATHITGPNGTLVYDEDTGFVPVVYDTDPAGVAPGWHLGRKERTVLLEPSVGSAHFIGVAPAVAPMTLALPNGDSISEFLVHFNSVNVTNVALEIRRNAAGTNAYRVIVTNGQPLFLQKRVAGTYSPVQTGTGAVAGPEVWNVISVEAIGDSFVISLNGEEQINVTDASLPSGTHIALSGFGAGLDVEVRLLRMYTENEVSVSGLEPGEQVTLRSATLPVQTVTANGGGVAAFTLDHWPHLAVQIRGAEYTVGGPIYGGDVLEFIPG